MQVVDQEKNIHCKITSKKRLSTMFLPKKTAYILLYLNLLWPSVGYSAAPISCMGLVAALSGEWQSVEIEVPITEELLRDIDTVDGTLSPLVAQAGPNAKSYLSEHKKLFLLDRPKIVWKTLAFEEQLAFLNALHADIDVESFLKTRKIEGLTFKRQVRENSKTVVFEDYVEWGSPYDGKNTELEIHLKSWSKDPGVALKAAEVYTLKVAGEKLPVHFQRVTLNPLLHHPGDIEKGIHSIHSFMTLYSQLSMLLELSIVSKGGHLRKNINGPALQFSPLSIGTLMFKTRFLTRRLLYKVLDKYDEEVINFSNGFVSLKLPGFYKNKNLVGFEVRVANDTRFPELEKYIRFADQRLDDPRFGFEDGFFDFFERENLPLFNAIKLGSGGSKEVQEIIGWVLMTSQSAYAGKALDYSPEFFTDGSRVDPGLVIPLLRRKDEADLNAKATKYFEHFGELQYLFTNYRRNYHLRGRSKDLGALELAQDRAVKRFVDLVDAGHSHISAEADKEVTRLMREFLVSSDLLHVLEKDFENSANRAASRYQSELKD